MKLHKSDILILVLSMFFIINISCNKKETKAPVNDLSVNQNQTNNDSVIDSEPPDPLSTQTNTTKPEPKSHLSEASKNVEDAGDDITTIGNTLISNSKKFKYFRRRSRKETNTYRPIKNNTTDFDSYNYELNENNEVKEPRLNRHKNNYASDDDDDNNNNDDSYYDDNDDDNNDDSYKYEFPDDREEDQNLSSRVHFYKDPSIPLDKFHVYAFNYLPADISSNTSEDERKIEQIMQKLTDGHQKLFNNQSTFTYSIETVHSHYTARELTEIYRASYGYPHNTNDHNSDVDFFQASSVRMPCP